MLVCYAFIGPAPYLSALYHPNFTTVCSSLVAQGQKINVGLKFFQLLACCMLYSYLYVICMLYKGNKMKIGSSFVMLFPNKKQFLHAYCSLLKLRPLIINSKQFPQNSIFSFKFVSLVNLCLTRLLYLINSFFGRVWLQCGCNKYLSVKMSDEIKNLFLKKHIF